MSLWVTDLIKVIVPGRSDGSWTGRFALRDLTGRCKWGIVHLHQSAMRLQTKNLFEGILDIPAHSQIRYCISALLPALPNSRIPTVIERC